MIDIDAPRLDIEPSLIIRYLRHSGWVADEFGRKLNRVYFKDEASDAVEIFFEKRADQEDKKKEVFSRSRRFPSSMEEILPMSATTSNRLHMIK